MSHYYHDIYENIFSFLTIEELYRFQPPGEYYDILWQYILNNLISLANIDAYYLIKIDKQTSHPVIINDYYNVSYQKLTRERFSEIVVIESQELPEHLTPREKVFHIMDKLSSNYNIIDDLSNYYIFIHKNIINPDLHHTNIFHYYNNASVSSLT